MFHWGKIPLVRLFFAFALGIVCCDNFYIEFNVVLSIALIFVPLLLLSLRLKFSYYNRWIPGLFYLMSSFIGGYFASAFHTQNIYLFSEEDNNIYYAQIIDHPLEKENSVQAIANIISSEGDAGRFINNDVLVYLEKDRAALELEVGDKIYFRSQFQSIQGRKNPATFDYANFMKRKYIYQQTYLSSENWSNAEVGTYFSPIIIAKKVQRQVKYIFEKYLKKKEALAIVSALVVGDKSELEVELKQGFSIAGAMHVLAVSGLHVGIIYKVLEFLFNLLFKNKKYQRLQAIIILIFLWSYAFITGLSPSVLRAVWMFSFIVIANLKLNHPNVYNTLAASAFFILVMNPNYLFHVGFQLSYVAVLGIVSIYPLLFKLLKTNNRIWNSVWGLTVVSFAAQISTFPIALYYFHQFPTYFLLSNYLAIPMAFMLLVGGLLLIIVHFLSSELAKGCGWLIDHLGDFLAYGINNISSLPYASIDRLWIDSLQLFLIYFILFFMICAFQLYWKKGIFISLTLVVLLFTSFLYKSYRSFNQENVIFYSIREANVIALVRSDEAFLYSDVDSIKNSSDWNYSIQPVLDSLGVSRYYINSPHLLDWVYADKISGNSIVISDFSSIIIHENELLFNYFLDNEFEQIIDLKYNNQVFKNAKMIYLSSNLKPWDARNWEVNLNMTHSLLEKGVIITR